MSARVVGFKFWANGAGDWTRPGLILAIATVAIHLFVNGQYGFFRDELYFIVCGGRPAWGYVDQPPLIPLIAHWSYTLFGTDLVGFRIMPAMAMAATVGLTAEFARALGGGPFAQWLAGLCVLGGGIFLADGLLLSTDMLQALSWLGCSWFIIVLIQTGDERWWIPFGLVAGISLLSKYLIGFFLVALALGFLATPLRRSLRTPWIYLGALIAFLLVLPNILWQQQHNWPFLELAKAGANGKNAILSAWEFFIQEILLIGPASAPVWLAGLWWASARPAHPIYRIFATAYAILFIVFVVLHGKAYYLAPIYPTLLAMGSVAIEDWLKGKAARVATLTIVVTVSALLSPLAIPLLPVQAYIAYANAIGFSPSTFSAERLTLGILPQQFADMFGWSEMAAKVAKVYHRLPPADRAQAVFFGQNYGEAAAIDVLGKPLGLPPAISGHNNYFLWGPRGHNGSVIIVVGGNRDQLTKEFRSVEEAGYISDPYAIPYETNKPIYVLRDSKVPLATMWPTLRKYE